MLKDGGGGYDGLMAEEMQRELDIMRSLSHDNVVQIKGILHDESNDSSKVIIIMELEDLVVDSASWPPLVRPFTRLAMLSLYAEYSFSVYQPRKVWKAIRPVWKRGERRIL